MEKKQKRRFLMAASVCLLVMAGVAYYYVMSSFSKETNTFFLYVDDDDTADSVATKLSAVSSTHSMAALKSFMRHSDYAVNVRPGRYAIEPGMSTFRIFRHLKNGMQTPVKLTIPSVRTMPRLAAELSKRLMLDSATIADALTDEETCRKYGYDTTTIACLFIPDTYDVYWNTSIDKLLERMQKENRRFWNDGRRRKAEQMKLTPEQVATLASIVDEETNNDGEKPMVAGMYYNRLMLRTAEYPDGMPLQADPTIKFAWKQFDLRRIYNKLLYIKSPYNTYKNTGLPPGPIRIASIAGIDAVLNHVRHDYLYMCAKEDFSGTHNFARTYEEHTANAKRYSDALNQRGIK